jgi:phosphoribosyl 1,2-cyclic phosphodiesterase
MLNIKKYASGSSGNCYKISDGETTIMIECGIRFQVIREAFSFKLSDVSGCLISHSHKDHCKAVKQISKAGIDCFMSEQTKKEIGISGHRIHTFKSRELIKIGTFSILTFSLQHDVENHGFLIQSKNGEKLCYITDTYYCRYKFSGINYYMIECNYEKELLEENIKSGVTPKEVRNRIIRSHFSLENVKEFFRSNDLTSVKQIHLIHISGNNGNPEQFKAEIQKITGKEVYV